ncbi:MAG TPA: response regulator [Polyangia bacterium]|nr:response regulator [Polyangia bacterium]
MLNILLVDDEPDLRVSLGEVLREEGHAVDLASDGEAAMACLAAQPFHLVISDVRLPKLDGLTLLRRIRRDFPSTEVLLMTAYGSIGDAVTAMKDNAVDYLTKPFDISALVTAVEQIDGRRRAREERPSAEPAPHDPIQVGPSPSLSEAMQRYEKELILSTIRSTGEKRQRAAKLLGISRKSLWKKLTKYGLQTRRAGGAPE